MKYIYLLLILSSLAGAIATYKLYKIVEKLENPNEGDDDFEF